MYSIFLKFQTEVCGFLQQRLESSVGEIYIEFLLRLEGEKGDGLGFGSGL